TPSDFLLDYGTGLVTVEVDDWDFFDEGSALVPGDQVTVTGTVDDNLFAGNTIEASSVYVASLGTVYFARSADEEGTWAAPQYFGDTVAAFNYTGWVTGVSDEGFTLGAGPTKITVDTSGLGPASDKQEIAVGDRV